MNSTRILYELLYLRYLSEYIWRVARYCSLLSVGITLPELNESHAPNEHSFAITADEYIPTAVQTAATEHTAGNLASAPYTYVTTTAGHFKIATLSANSLAAGNAAGDLALKPNIRRSSELELEKDSFDRALRDSYVVPIDFSIIDMENPLTQYSSAQQLSTSDEILTGAVEEKVAVIITAQPSSMTSLNLNRRS